MTPLPTLFAAHGAPTFALEPGRAGPGLAALGRTLPRPKAVLVVSPHWMTRTVRVTASPRPPTIHDFHGFDPELYELQYPVAGDPALADRIVARLRGAGWAAETDAERGLDHGAWVPLRYLYPEGDVPVVQASLPGSLDAAGAFEYGRALAPFAAQGVLVVGSGNLTHNLGDFRAARGVAQPYVEPFVDWVRAAATAGDAARLRRALDEAPGARRAHPTPEHFLPLLVAAGAAPAATPVTVIEGGIDHGMLSMDSIVFGCDEAVGP